MTPFRYFFGRVSDVVHTYSGAMIGARGGAAQRLRVPVVLWVNWCGGMGLSHHVVFRSFSRRWCGRISPNIA